MLAIRAHGARFQLGYALSLFATLALGVGCDKKAQEPASATSPLLGVDPKPAPASPLLAPPAAGSASQALQITWADPPEFKRVPPSNPMRKASYVVPRAAGDAEDGELAVFYFGPGQGGGIDANVERWVKQFADAKPSDVKRADREANGLRQHTVELESGTFSAGMAMGGSGAPKPNYGLLGGIVEAPSGAYFFKLTGPSATVKHARAAFYQLLDSVKAP